MQQDYKNIPVWGKSYAEISKETEEEKKIRKRLEGARMDTREGKDGRMEKKGKKVIVRAGDMSFSLVYISASDKENTEQFAPYCDGSPEGKYGVVWRSGCVQDRYVFDTWEYAAEFIMISHSWAD